MTCAEVLGRRGHGIPWPCNLLFSDGPGCAGSCCRVLIDAGESAAAGGVVFKVLPPMPRLEVSISGLPAAVLAGEIVHCTMWLKNSGAMTLQHLSMAAAGGTHIYLGSGPSSGVGTPAVASTFARAEAARSPGPSEAAKCQQGASLAGDGASVAPSNPNAVAAAACSPSHNKGGNRRSSLGSIAGHLLEPLPAPSFRHDVIVFTLPNVRMSVGQDLALPVWFRCGANGSRAQSCSSMDRRGRRECFCVRSFAECLKRELLT